MKIYSQDFKRLQDVMFKHRMTAIFIPVYAMVPQMTYLRLDVYKKKRDFLHLIYETSSVYNFPFMGPFNYSERIRQYSISQFYLHCETKKK